MCDDERDQRFNTQAFALVHFLVDQRLTLNRLCVVDSTALTAQARRDLLDLAKRHQVPATLMLFNTPLATCVERDEKRERTVGRPTIERHFQALEQAKVQIVQEGFDQVVELQEQDLENIHIEILFRPVVRTSQRPLRHELADSRRVEHPSVLALPKPMTNGANGASYAPPGQPPAAAAARPAMPPPNAAPPNAAPVRSPEAAAPVKPNAPAAAQPGPALQPKVPKPPLPAVPTAPVAPIRPPVSRPMPLEAKSPGRG